MSKTWDFLHVEKPNKIPFHTSVDIERSVVGISFTKEIDGYYSFFIAPTFSFVSPVISRKLVFSYEEKPELPFVYFKAGTMTIEGKEVFLLLEKGD